MNALAKILGSALSSIPIILVLKEFNIAGWESSAFITAMTIFVVLGLLIGYIFKIDFLPCFATSAMITFVIFLLISTTTAIVMWCIFWILIILIIIAYR